MFERLVIDRPLIGPVNDFRRQLGLKTVKHIYSRWIYSPEQVLCLFPNWFAKPAADWPQNTKLMGFLHYDEDPEAQLPADVIDFLAAGQKPILITNSTAITQATEFFGQAIDALRALGLPCIVLTPHSSNITRTLNPERELYVPYLPHKKLLPHCRAIIHSGTIGSSVLALSCELPQLLMPMYYDQFDNCARLKKMEVALTLPRKKWTAKNISIALQRLLSSKDIQLNCKKFAEKVDFQQAGKDLCDHIETKISTLNV